jgi:16S rRNA processing protein RimM
MATPLVAVGEVQRPYGLRGEVRVRVLTDRPAERFRGLGDCILWKPTGDVRQAGHISEYRFEGDALLLKLEGVDSPERARQLAGWLLAVDRAEALPAPHGCFYPWQLEGARVVTRDGRVAGTFVGIEGGGAQDLWVVDDGQRRHLIPAVAEIVVEVSVAEQRIVIDPPDGLLEL